MDKLNDLWFNDSPFLGYHMEFKLRILSIKITFKINYKLSWESALMAILSLKIYLDYRVSNNNVNMIVLYFLDIDRSTYIDI